MTQPERATLHATTRSMLGHVVRIGSNSRELIRHVDEAFAAWPRARGSADIRIRFDVEASRRRGSTTKATARNGKTGDSADDLALRYILPTPDRLAIRGRGVTVNADATRGRARGVIAAERLGNVADLRYRVLEATVLFLVTARARVPFHAAAVVQGDVAVLMAGPSGAGKSTAAWAAARAGWSLLSEDCVYLQDGERPRVWGWPGFVHLDASAGRFFPELGASVPRVRANGKRKIAVETPPVAGGALWARRAILCLLERTSAGPRVDPLARSEALRIVTSRLEPGFDRFAIELPAVLAAVLEPVAWRLDPGSDPAEVPDLLDRILAAVSLTR